MQKIFVGDVQGCGDELAELVAAARRRFGEEFELWCVGDLVNRGPRNLLALEIVRGLQSQGRAFMVLGNHDVALLAVRFGLRRLRLLDSVGDVLESCEADDWIDWLRAQPIAHTGVLDDGTPFAMVHASVHPSWSLDELTDHAQRVAKRLGSPDRSAARALLAARAEDDAELDDLARLTRCRSIASDGTWSSAVPMEGRRAWHEVWAERRHGYGVVYGHWALQGLHVAAGLRGLDSGCVHHGRGRDGYLTGWIPDSHAAFPEVDDRFIRVPAKRAYYAERVAEVG